MTVGWSGLPQCYEFDTGEILVGIQPYMNYHGVCGLMHREYMVETVRHCKAFLNAEYYLRPGSGMSMYPRRLSMERKVRQELVDGAVAIHFPAEPDFGLEMDLVYRPHGDAVDMRMVIRPSIDIEKFEIFFASYVVEAFDETWVPLANGDGTEEWAKLDNRAVLNRTFGVVRDEESRAVIRDGRYGKELPEGIHRDIEARPFSKPVMVARNSQNGFGLAFLCDARVTTYLTGQYHGWDTAHDWCYGEDLVAGREMVADTRLVYRRFVDAEAVQKGGAELWEGFVDGR